MRAPAPNQQIDSSIDTTLLTSAQACALLDVKPATLYSYVSRGLIRGVHPGRGRSRLYIADDVARLATRSAARRGHAPVAAGALRWGEPVLESAITSISDGVLAYRGHRIDTLLTSTFEQVADLLWQQPTTAWPAPRPRLRLPAAAPVWRLVAAVPQLALADADRWGRSEAAELAAARALIRALASIVGDHTASTGTVAERAAASLGLPASATPVLDAALIAIADHELNASTFAARIAASAGADLHACVGAALYTVTGPRHGGACDRIDAFLADLPASPAAIRPAIAARLRRGDLPGLGHRLYPAGDPRTPLVLDAARRLRPRGRGARRLAAVEALIDAVARLGGELPSVDLGLCAAAAALDAPPGTATALFALGRTAGWVAHILEQRASNALLRPRARYVGPPVAHG
jgi:citrate synthase